MPAMIDVHTHLGYRSGAAFRAGNFSRQTILDELDQFAARGVVAVASAGTDRGDLTLALRDENHPGARIRTAWRGLAPPEAGPNPPMRDAPFGVSTIDDVRAAVRELAARHADYVKIWVDDRNGAVPKLSPDLYRAIIAEAHAQNLRVFAHIAALADAKDLLRAGIDGFLHPPRDRDVDEELLRLLKERPQVFFALTLFAPRLNAYGARPSWLDEPPIRSTAAAEVIDQLAAVAESRRGDALAVARAEWDQIARNVRALNAAGVPLALGTDVGGASAGGLFGWTEHIELEHMVAAGMTAAQAIAAATRTAAGILRFDDLGTIAPGRSADFIVLDANPLDAIANTRRIDRVARRGMLRPPVTGGRPR
jgi:imidazolonepropionase-like amidohydrolase